MIHTINHNCSVTAFGWCSILAAITVSCKIRLGVFLIIFELVLTCMTIKMPQPDMCISSFPRFFAWLVEIFAQFFLHLDLTLDTLGLFAASGIKIRLKNGLKIVSDLLIIHVPTLLVNQEVCCPDQISCLPKSCQISSDVI